MSVGGVTVVRVAASRLGPWNGSVVRALVTVGSLTVVSKAAATGKDVTIAAVFGPGTTLDGYLIALLIPTFVSTVVAGSFTSAVIPAYVTLREREGRDLARGLASSVLFLGLLATMTLGVLIALGAPGLLHVVAPGLDAAKLQHTRKLLFLLLPSLLFSGVATIYAALLNAEERYAASALAPALTPLLPTAFLLIFSVNIQGVAIATTLGYCLEASCLGFVMKREFGLVLPIWRGWTPQLRAVRRQYGAMVAGALLVSSTVVVDQAMATTLGPGSVSILSYGGKVPGLVVAIGSITVSAAVLPYFSRLAANGENEQLRRSLRFATGVTFFLSVPAVAILVVASQPLVSLLFARGSFSASDVLPVTHVQQLLLLEVPFYLLSIVVVRMISSLQANRLLLIGSAISVILNVALNAVLMSFLGVAGIALSTSIVYAVMFSLLRLALGRLLRRTTV